MKKASLIIISILFTLSFLMISILPIYAQNNNGTYIIERISRRVEIKYGIYIFMYDTITLRSSSNVTTLKSFPFGFSYEYKSNILGCYAYNFSDGGDPLEATLAQDIEKPGFYWMKIHFPTSIELEKGESYNFSILSILENVISEKKENDTWRYSINFPAYPSLTKEVEKFETSIVLPQKINYTQTEFEEFAGTTVEESNITANTIVKYTWENLEEFYYRPKEKDRISFLAINPIQRIVLNELMREIRFDETGNVYVSDSYHITSKAIVEVNSIELALPWNASNIVVWDEFGKPTVKPNRVNEERNIYKVEMEPAMQPNDSRRFKVSYSLPKSKYVIRKNFENFSFNLTFFENMNLLVKDFSLKITLPEGAKILEIEASNFDYSTIQKKVFTYSISYIFDKPVIPQLTSLKIHLKYSYNLLWSSFRPTLWVGTALVLVYLVAFVWQRQKLKPAVMIPTIRVSPEELRRFVEAYEEKRRIVSELEVLETKVRKGKIPRRRYKIRRKTLESRISSLNRRIAELKERIRRAGARYADAIRQLEVAETELETVEVDIRRIEARYRRGEVSRGVYRRLLEEYNKRKEKALVTIDGVLIRFSEEIR